MLADPPRSLYLLLIVAAIVAGAVAIRFQTRKSFLLFLGVACIWLVVFLVDTFIESPREEAVRRIIAMAKAAEAGNEPEFMTHVSAKASFDRPIPWHLIREHRPIITIFEFSRDDYNMTKGFATVGFMAKAEASTGMMLKYVQAVFAEEADGTWKLRSVEFFNPATRQKEPLP